METVEKDRKNIWHPYTQMGKGIASIPILKAKGAYLYSQNQKRYLDGISSWWVNLHGHSHPYILGKIKNQLEILQQIIFADFTHDAAVELSERLLTLLPTYSKVFYSDNGSTATEIALKMALQYFYNQDCKTKRRKIVCLKGGFHGETFGAMALSKSNPFFKPFWSYLFQVETIDPPTQGFEASSLAQLEEILKQEETACFIFEPLILGCGGMIVYPPAALAALLALCKKYEVLTIADEVMTGFGRIGPLFACEYIQERADIVCLSKGLTGGYLPLGATLCREKIFNAFLGQDLHKALLHGHSYTGNALACTSALASLDLLLEKSCAEKREKIHRAHQTFCLKWQGHPQLKRCETLGTLLILEYRVDRASYFHTLRDKLYNFFLNKGILLRPLGNVVYVMPPYCIEESELHFLYDQLILTFEGSLWN